MSQFVDLFSAFLYLLKHKRLHIIRNKQISMIYRTALLAVQLLALRNRIILGMIQKQIFYVQTLGQFAGIFYGRVVLLIWLIFVCL